MSLTHEFGIIDDINEKTYERYISENYQCISVKDEHLNVLVKPLSLIKTYFHSLNRPNYGLSYHGITLIPPESLSMFLDAILSVKDLKHHNDITLLSKKIIQDKNDNKYMIHYGI